MKCPETLRIIQKAARDSTEPLLYTGIATLTR
jgi:hypothetical protein